MADYEHNGTPITFDPANCAFRASIAGVIVRKPSLAAIKKAIDKTSAFVPFTAIVSQWGEKPKVIKIINQKVSKHSGYSQTRRVLFIDEDGHQHSPENLYVNTPENLKLLNAANKHDADMSKQKKALEEESDRLWNLVHRVTVEDKK